MPKFSIIIPVYNVAPYLRECLDSVLAQTFTDWEAICVDDGSTDGSGAILDEYREKVEKLDGGGRRMVVIHQANAGVSAARNAALDVAQGEWILFLDGDDRLRIDGLQILNQYGISSSVDGVLVYPYIPHWDGGLIPERKHPNCMLIPDATIEDLVLGPYAANGFPFSRVYRREVFGRLRFHEGVRMAEDVMFWFDALTIHAHWTIIESEYYLYRQRSDSVCGRRDPHDCVAIYDSILYVFQVMERHFCIGSLGKTAYIKRFPFSPRIYNEVFILRYRELGSCERQQFFDAVAKVLAQLEDYPFFKHVRIQFFLIKYGFRCLVPLVSWMVKVRKDMSRFFKKIGD